MSIQTLEMKPSNWQDYYFGSGMDANMMLSELYKSRRAK